MLATQQGNKDIVELMIKHCVDLNLRAKVRDTLQLSIISTITIITMMTKQYIIIYIRFTNKAVQCHKNCNCYTVHVFVRMGGLH